MKPLAELLENPKPKRTKGFEFTNTKILLRIPREDRSPDLVQQLIMKNRPLAVQVAKEIWEKYSKYAGAVFDFDDVLSAAMVGLSVSINRFDFRFNTEFSTYAMHWIRQAATREVHNNIGAARIPIHFQEKLRKWTKAKDAGLDSKSLAATVDYQFLSKRTYLSASTGQDGCTILDSICSGQSSCSPRMRNSDNPEIMVLKNDLRRRILESFQKMNNPRNRDLLCMRYGLNDTDESHTLEEVGIEFGLTRERVRQICEKYINKIVRMKFFDDDELQFFRG